MLSTSSPPAHALFFVTVGSYVLRPGAIAAEAAVEENAVDLHPVLAAEAGRPELSPVSVSLLHGEAPMPNHGADAHDVGGPKLGVESPFGVCLG